MSHKPGFKLRALIGAFILLLLFGVMFALHYQVIRLYVVVSESMMPTLEVGDRILVDSAGLYERHSVVSFQDPSRRDNPDEQLIKRIIGVPGDRIEIRGGLLYVNGEPQYSPDVTSNLINWPDVRVDVPLHHVFVLGDNRNYSEDSLNFGPLPEKDITGMLTAIVWPPGRWGEVDGFEVYNTPVERSGGGGDGSR